MQQAQPTRGRSKSAQPDKSRSRSRRSQSVATIAPTEAYPEARPARRRAVAVQSRRGRAQQRASSEGATPSVPITLPLQGSEQPPEEVPPQGGPRGGPFLVKSGRNAKAAKRVKSEEISTGVPNKRTTRDMAEFLNAYGNLDPGFQALTRRLPLVSASGRPKKRPGKKKNGGLEAILEHHDIKDDPYYMKPPLPTHIK